ncbi:MAG TPA: c-type cytochrome [Usitatibacter sp.]|jgi:cytochrome c553|nr:c-type cytochrome [Usitatibacter sp.]
MALVYASATAVASAAESKPDLERGKQLATTVCAACHGANGVSPSPAQPHLAGQHAGYIATQLALFKSGARPNPIMQAMAASLTPEDMASVGAYFESLAPAHSVARDKALADKGQKLWRAGNKALGVPACAGCHGASGHGIAAPYPRLAGQYPSLLAAWLKDYGTGTRQSDVMGPIASRLSENDQKALVEYISGLQ